jgi:hypothetical protein
MTAVRKGALFVVFQRGYRSNPEASGDQKTVGNRGF